MPQGPLATLTGWEVLTMMIVGLDVGFGYTKCVTARGTDVFPSVVGEWSSGGFRLGAGLGSLGRPDGIEGVTVDGRSYTVGERALRLAHRRFVGLSRSWVDGAEFRVLALTALVRTLEHPGEPVTLVTGLPVADVEPHGETLRRQLEGTHELQLEPGGRVWRVTIGRVRVLPQPLGTVLAQLLDPRGQLAGPEGLQVRVGVLDVGFRTTDYFTLDGLAVVPAHCLTRNTRMADLLLDLGREVYRRWGVEQDPHALDEPLRRGALHVGGDTVSLGALLEPWLDRHAEAIVAHARMLWGEGARGLARLWVTGGGGAVLGSRLQALASHAEIVPHARLQNAMGYFRYGQRLQRELNGMRDPVSA
jgi:plasmid segregation protein ParM